LNRSGLGFRSLKIYYNGDGMGKKKKELSRDEKNEMVKEAMWKKACEGDVQATKIYLKMDKMEKEEEERQLTREKMKISPEERLRELVGLSKEVEETYTKKHKGKK
jgi:hypothetical protein